ncbi:glutathione S-transferase family protein [Ovoidimarina sediminis]|uniref:glutathione S-transferase family protein n=1 Tax=Ovoidimarina sediminis TaxID=3079856 RepID=UPI00290E1E09|nr:glutathione S-transferase family protein [Rhodophyticola sp. MJ-SS7]MDU8945494.1 glutathione S-transferase family protein [Rhodophyticola sp. MJ-SS7]
MTKPTIYHIPICPFSQRVEILLELKGLRDAIDFYVIDITKPRPAWLLDYTGGTTALPVLVDESDRALKESLVILRYVEERYDARPVARQEPFERGLERLLITKSDAFANTGYGYVMNRDRARTAKFRDKLLAIYRDIDVFLSQHNPDGTFLFDSFGLADLVFTPLMLRFWFLEYYEGFTLPEAIEFSRVLRWRDACLAHPAAQQVSFDQIVKLYYDYAVGFGNGARPDGRARSSFTFEPDWPDRPMPPTDKYDRIASDAELGLIP